MKSMVEKVMECFMALLPFLSKGGKKGVEQMKDFSELVTGQYAFLMSQLENVLKDYFELSSKVKEMHAEILELKTELVAALQHQCNVNDCIKRN